MTIRRATLAATVAILGLVAVVGVVTTAGGLGGPTGHDAGDGPLSTHLDGRADQVLALDPVNAGRTYSVAVPLCVLTGERVALTGARPLDTLGSDADWTFLGARVRLVPAGATNAFLGADGFPPTGYADDYATLEGTEVTTRCDGDPAARRVEAILGFRSTNGGNGGGWTSLEIDYRQDGKPYSLVVHDTWVLCGPATSSVAECSDYLRGG
jgi:hypothetical protein